MFDAGLYYHIQSTSTISNGSHQELQNNQSSYKISTSTIKYSPNQLPEDKTRIANGDKIPLTKQTICCTLEYVKICERLITGLKQWKPYHCFPEALMYSICE